MALDFVGAEWHLDQRGGYHGDGLDGLGVRVRASAYQGTDLLLFASSAMSVSLQIRMASGSEY
jgi:hypothetical protein